MARQLIIKEQVPFFIYSECDFRWGSLTGYTSAQKDFVIKSGGEILAVAHYDEELDFDHWWLNPNHEGRLDHLFLVKRGIKLHEQGILVGN